MHINETRYLKGCCADVQPQEVTGNAWDSHTAACSPSRRCPRPSVPGKFCFRNVPAPLASSLLPRGLHARRAARAAKPKRGLPDPRAR
eukprot:scaffold57533_cov51-Phaeocystis_antarctica.AAC.2